MLVGRDLGAEDAEFGPAVALRHVAEHLIVGAVLLDHIDDVLDQTRLTDPLGDHPRWLVGPRRGESVADRSGTHVAGHALRERGQIVIAGDRQDRYRAVIVVGVEPCGGTAGLRLHGQPLDVGDCQPLPRRIDDDGPRMPADRNQAEQLRAPSLVRLPVHHRHRVLGAVADVEPFAVRRESQGVGHRTVEVRRGAFRPGRVHHVAGRDVEDAERVTSRVGADNVAAIRGDREGRRMQADEHLAHGIGAQVHDAHRALAGDVPNRIDADARPFARRSRQVVRPRAAAAPVAHERPVAHEDHVVGSDTHVEGAEHVASRCVDFEQTVREVAADVEPAAVGRDGQAARNVAGPLRGIGRRELHRVRGHDRLVAHGEHLHRAMHVAHVEPATVGGEDEPRVALNRLPVGLEIPVGIVVAGRPEGVVRGGLHAAEDLAAGRIEQHDLVGLSGGREHPAVGRHCEHLRPQTRQFHLQAHGGHDLVDRQHGRVAVGPSHGGGDVQPLVGRSAGGGDQRQQRGAEVQGGDQPHVSVPL